jgi:hypothetical protein
MQFFLAAAAAATFATSGNAALLSASSQRLRGIQERAINATVDKNVTAKDVARLRDSMTAMVGKLEHLMSVEHSKNFNQSGVGADLQKFIVELNTTLKDTKSEKDPAVAMRKLRRVQAGFRKLAAELATRQNSLQKEGEAEVDAVLLGVLMAERNETINTQLDVMKTPTFAALDASKTLLKKHDASQPLFQQLAAYMDKHSGQKTGSALRGKRSQSIARALSYFTARVQAMEKEEAKSKTAHEKRERDIDALLKKASKKEAHSMQGLKRRSERLYKKNVLMHHRQLKLMQDVVTALRSGDMGAVDNAQAALKASLTALKAKTADFLYLIQTS